MDSTRQHRHKFVRIIAVISLPIVASFLSPVPVQVVSTKTALSRFSWPPGASPIPVSERQLRSLLPLSLKKSIEDPKQQAVTPTSSVRGFFAQRGVDDRQFNLLLNLGFVILVSAAVLGRVITVDIEGWRGWTPSEVLLRIIPDNWENYMSVLTDHPVAVKAITSGTVYTVGDWIAQLYEGKSLGDIDRGRVVRSAAAGLIGHGPLSHLWYQISEDVFGWIGWDGWWVTAPKIGLDQLIWSPFWNACYIALLGIFKREEWRGTWSQIKQTAFPLVLSGLKLWPIAHVVTYGLIPVENRLLWVDLVEILWVTILSRQAAEAGGDVEAAASGEGGEHKSKAEAEANIAAAIPSPVVVENPTVRDALLEGNNLPPKREQDALREPVDR